MIDVLAPKTTSFVATLNDPLGTASRLSEIMRTGQPEFVFCIGSTRTSDLKGISAAGAGPDERRLTPSIDADILSRGQPRSGESLPVSPIGIVSPVVISRTCIKLLHSPLRVVDCGTFRAPLECDLQAGRFPANCVLSGQALQSDNVQSLFEQGRNFASALSREGYVIIGECVPGGTTSALAVLMGSGVAAQKLVAGSVVGDTRDLKVQLAELGLARAGISLGKPMNNPLRLLSAVGDPMQAFAAGLAFAASPMVPVVLAGGSQMLAVYQLCRLFSRFYGVPLNVENIFVVTTKWLVNDGFSNTRQLAELLSAPFSAAMADFQCSKFEGLRAYENGHVKEGIGAGALMAAAQARLGLSNAELVAAIDTTYEELLGGSAARMTEETSEIAEIIE